MKASRGQYENIKNFQKNRKTKSRTVWNAQHTQVNVCFIFRNKNIANLYRAFKNSGDNRTLVFTEVHRTE